MLVTRAKGAAELVASAAPPLGLLERSEFIETTIEMEEGDGFLLYTDGLYGAATNAAARWTPERLRDMLEPGARDAQALLELIIERTAPDDGVSIPDAHGAVAVTGGDNGRDISS